MDRLEKPAMTTSMETISALARMREELSAPAAAILAGCADLDGVLRAQGLVEFAEDGEELVRAAAELERDLKEIFDKATVAASGDETDTAALQKKLRHDLKNSIAVVLGNLEMMQEDLGDAGEPALLTTVTGLIERAGQLSDAIDGVVSLVAPARRRA